MLIGRLNINLRCDTIDSSDMKNCLQAAERGEEGGGGSVVQIVTDPETGAKTVRRIPLKSDFIRELEKRRNDAS